MLHVVYLTGKERTENICFAFIFTGDIDGTGQHMIGAIDLLV